MRKLIVLVLSAFLLGMSVVGCADNPTSTNQEQPKGEKPDSPSGPGDQTG